MSFHSNLSFETARYRISAKYVDKMKLGEIWLFSLGISGAGDLDFVGNLEYRFPLVCGDLG